MGEVQNLAATKEAQTVAVELKPNTVCQGVDTFTDTRRDRFAVQGEVKTGWSLTTSDDQITTSITDLKKAIDISNELEVGALFGLFSANAKTQFTRKLQLTEKSVVVLVNYKHPRVEYVKPFHAPQ